MKRTSIILLFLVLLALQVRSQCVGSQTASMSPVGPYSTGQVVTVSYTLSSFTQLNSNWIIAFDIDYGTGWSSISQISAPGNPGGSNGSWIWDTQNTYPSGLSFGPGYRFQNTGWNSDWGTSSTGPFTLSFQLVVGSSCLPQDLSVDLSVIGDCQTGGWVSAGCCPIVPYSIYSGTSLGNGNISLTANPTDISCYGFSDGSINLNVSGGAGSYSYSWSNGATTAAISNLTAGSYSVTVTDANGCVATENFTISSGSPITVLATFDQTICSGYTPSSLNASSGGVAGTYSWADASNPLVILGTGSNFSPPPLTSTTAYTVTLTDNNGCVATDDIVITVSPVPSVSLTAVPNPACEGDDVLLTATSSIPVNQYKFQVNSGSWSNLTSPGWGNSSSFTYNNITTTTQFRVKVKENNGCNASGWSTITVPINNINTPLISHN